MKIDELFNSRRDLFLPFAVDVHGGVVPLFSKNKENKNWERATTYQLQIQEFDPDTFVLDIDNKNGKNGLAYLKNFIDILKGEAYYIEYTKSGGFHLFFKSKRVYKNKPKISPNNEVELLTKDVFIHPSTNYVVLKSEEPKECSSVVDNIILELIAEAQPKSKRTKLNSNKTYKFKAPVPQEMEQVANILRVMELSYDVWIKVMLAIHESVKPFYGDELAFKYFKYCSEGLSWNSEADSEEALRNRWDNIKIYEGTTVTWGYIKYITDKTKQKEITTCQN